MLKSMTILSLWSAEREMNIMKNTSNGPKPVKRTELKMEQKLSVKLN